MLILSFIFLGGRKGKGKGVGDGESRELELPSGWSL
jgi:hypothetical protein